MLELMVIADDLTGALDTGIQFPTSRMQICIIDKDAERFLQEVGEDTQVLVVDTETRHQTAQEAYSVVYKLVREAMEAGVCHIYKKTDSALRGNIGSELTALLEASGRKYLHFFPAYPKLDRLTVGGVHYIKGIPVADSVFGQDPFEPVTCSRVSDLIAQQSIAHTTSADSFSSGLTEGILIYNADSDDALRSIACTLHRQDELHILAGCAGFASVLAEYVNLCQEITADYTIPHRMMTVCGSINPITKLQIENAKQSGANVVQLTAYQKLNETWIESPEAAQLISVIQQLLDSSSNSLIIDCGGELEESLHPIAATTEDLREQVADIMGEIARRLLDNGIERTLLITGGDTLMAFLQKNDVRNLWPISEILPGMVLCGAEYQGKRIYLISKSGGFGNPNALIELETILKASRVR